MDITSHMARQYRGPDRVVEGFPQPHHSTGRGLEGQSADQGLPKKAAHGRWRMVADPRYKLIDGFFEDRTLFDLEHDPLETENVAAANPGVVARLEKRFANA